VECGCALKKTGSAIHNMNINKKVRELLLSNPEVSDVIIKKNGEVHVKIRTKKRGLFVRKWFLDGYIWGNKYDGSHGKIE